MGLGTSLLHNRTVVGDVGRRSPWWLEVGALLLTCQRLAAGSVETNTPPAPEIPFSLSAWTTSVSVRAGAGYKDNVLLSSVSPAGSPFTASGMDVFVMRLPYDGTECSILLTADHRHYFSVPEANEELTVLASGQVRKTFDSGWALGGTAYYFFMNQVFDASVTEAEAGGDPAIDPIVLARGHTLGLRPVTGRSLGRQNWLDLEFPLSRQLYDQNAEDDLVLYDYWEYGSRLVWRHEYGYRSEFNLSYGLNRRPYDHRPQVDAEGQEQPGTDLGFEWQRAEFLWRQVWDRQRFWRTTTRLGLDVNADNGSGYYDYHKYFVSEEVRLRTHGWDLRVQAGANWYQYAVQTAVSDDPSRSSEDGENRQKILLSATVRLERQLGSHWKAMAEYEYEQSLSNEDFDRYQVNTASAAIEFEF
jgi:hypothetical protein